MGRETSEDSVYITKRLSNFGYFRTRGLLGSLDGEGFISQDSIEFPVTEFKRLISKDVEINEDTNFIIIDIPERPEADV